MTLRKKMISEAFAGTLCHHRKRFSSADNLTFEEFLEVNKKITKEIFDDFVKAKNLPGEETTVDIMMVGLRAFFDLLPREAKLTTIFHDVDNKGSRPGWAYNVKKRRFRR